MLKLAFLLAKANDVSYYLWVDLSILADVQNTPIYSATSSLAFYGLGHTELTKSIRD